MITLCLVSLNLIKRYEEYLKESILKHTKHISEVLYCDIDMEEGQQEETIRGVKFIRFAHPNTFTVNGKKIFKPSEASPHWVWAHVFAHPLGLTECIKRAINDYIYVCDPDTLFLGAADEVFLNLLNKYDLRFIGASHHAGINFASGWFPNAINLMTKKAYMPTEEFFAGKIKMIRAINLPPATSDAFDHLMKDQFFFQGRMPEFMDRFPNKEGICDTGANLYLWNEHIKGKWLSFQSLDIHTYRTKFYRTNFGLKDNLPKITQVDKLFWHATGGQDEKQPYWSDFLKTYREEV